jgi:hypothetical protein
MCKQHLNAFAITARSFECFGLGQPCGAQFEFTMAAIAQNLRRLAKLLIRPPPVTEACFA